ncbi:hypothetical protein FD01_GL002056 [Lacticaseibacillus manihotivorans DSM 13343 = JCM 12514]|uniref:Uncharacterized protein n=1 Tax=Lacticaseibacillus manihotivorans DSM 13343 = JCM 12514 TaxID=1423769 RepID=A0A0R1QGX9_9LACO|nr:hypothetical protein [Lacticaseibacillus manihotivorans]KRL41940.1 hypothetical protein FD01_GL002056 [Lacticaseibacillus manihotivorans DSM 13343 = JCM 12514]
MATGLGNLQASGFVTLTDDQRSEMLSSVLQDFIANGRFTNSTSAIALDHTAAL